MVKTSKLRNLGWGGTVDTGTWGTMRLSSPKWRVPLFFPTLLFLTLTCGTGSDGYNDKVERAEKLAMEGDSSGAIKELRAAALQVC